MSTEDIRDLLFAVTLALCAGAGRVIAPLSVQYAIDAGLDQATVGRAAAVGTSAVLLAGVSSVLLNRRLHGWVERSVAALRRAGLRRVHDMSAATADALPSGDLTARLSTDVDQVSTFAQGGGIQLVTNSAQLVVATAVMLAYSWQLAVPVLALAGAAFAVMLVMQRVIARRYGTARQYLSALHVAVTEAVLGVAVTRSTGTGTRARGKLDAAIDRARDSLIRTLVPLHTNTALGEIAISTMTVTVLLGGVWWAVSADPARLSAGQVVAMVFLVGFFVRPLQFLVQSLGEAQNALAGWRRARDLICIPSAEVVDGVPVPAGPIGVCVEGVSARYGDGPLVLHDVNVRIAPGEHVAVVGRTGSGKSTFAKLLTQRLEPAAGGIRLSGVPLSLVTSASLPGRVVIVPQDPFLFDGTIAGNVVVGTPGATAGDALRILTDLGVRDWLDALPNGLDTPVGLRGERLSGGERQLVALARTALADPDLVVFDEATSGVDPATDVTVQRAMAALTRGRTTVSIAHRMLTAATADRVLVFSDGRIVQAGTHDALVHEPGVYAGLVAAWTEV